MKRLIGTSVFVVALLSFNSLLAVAQGETVRVHSHVATIGIAIDWLGIVR